VVILPKRDRILPLSRAAGEGAGGRGPSRAQCDPVRRVPIHRHPNLPEEFWGRCEPGRAEGARPSRPIVGFIALLLLAFCIAPPLAAQTVLSADTAAVASIRVEPDSAITVGDRFRAAVFVRAPAGARVQLVVPPAADGAYQTVDSIRSYPPDSTGLHRAVATMVLWTADPPSAARAEVRITLPGGGVQTLPIGIPLPATHAVLPADSTQPRPPKDIVPIPQRAWTWAWIAAAVLVIALLLAWWMMRRRRGPRAAAPADPRGHALAELDRLRASGLLEKDVEAFVAGTSAVLREFAAAADPTLGPDLTTAELLDRLARTGARAEDVASIESALGHADLAKFARQRLTPGRALEDWEAARRWVQGFGRPASAEPPLAGAAR
jgi:hypothetical protein